MKKEKKQAHRIFQLIFCILTKIYYFSYYFLSYYQTEYE